MSTAPLNTLGIIGVVAGVIIVITILLVIACIVILCGCCLIKISKKKKKQVPKDSNRDLETGPRLTNGAQPEPSETRPMLEHNIVHPTPSIIIKDSPAKAKSSTSKRSTTTPRSESQRQLLPKQNQELSPEELSSPPRSPSFKSAMQSPDSTGACAYATPSSQIFVEMEKQTRSSTVSDTQKKPSKNMELPIPRCNTAPPNSMTLISLSPPPVHIYPPLPDLEKSNSPLLDKSVPIISSDPTLMEFEGGDVQFEYPVPIKHLEEYYSINVVKSLNSQSNIPSTNKRKSHSDSADLSDTSDSKKPHIIPSTDVTLSLSERIESVEETNFSINTANCDINNRDNRDSVISNTCSMLSEPEMPSLLAGQEVTLSETDSEGEGGKKYYHHTYGPEEERRPYGKKAVRPDTEDESEKSIFQPLSKEVRDRHKPDTSLDNISVVSSLTSDLITNKSPNIILSPDEIGTSNNTKSTFPLQETNLIAPEIGYVVPFTDSIISNTNSIVTDTDSIIPDSNTSALSKDSPYPDILNSNATKPDIISHVTHLPEPILDGPPILNRDFIVNSITGTIHSFDPDSNVSSMDTANYNLPLSLIESVNSPQGPGSEKYNTNISVNSDVSVAFLGPTSPKMQTDSIKTESDQSSIPSLSEINMNEGLGPYRMHRTVDGVPPPDSVPQPIPSDRTVFLSDESEINSVYVSASDTKSIGSSSPLSLYEEGATLDPGVDYPALLHNTILPNQQQQQQQQQQQHIYLDNNSDYSMMLQNPSQIQDTELTPTSSLQLVQTGDKTSENSNVGHISESPQTGASILTSSLTVNGDHDTIISESGTSDPLIDSSQFRLLEADSIAPDNDAVPLNEDSIVPTYARGHNANLRNEVDNAPPLYNDNNQNLSPVFTPPQLAAPPFIPPTDQTRQVQRSVGTPITFRDYIAKEWIGTSDNAKRVRNGYSELENMGYTHLMSIRGDNYCAVRSTLFQTFCIEDFSQCSFLANMKPPREALKIVAPMMEKYPYLSKWSFANKREFSELGTTQEVLELCVANLALEVETVRLWNPLDRMVYIYSKLNKQKEIFDFSLMEALKFYMFIKAAEFWELQNIGKDLPDPMFILFLREDSYDLQEFLFNHLNNVGDGGGLEMIEMFLLGHTLDLQIKVTRISSFGKEDYITYFPPGEYPRQKIISISAEDDRHYNVLATLVNIDDFFIPEGKLRN